MGRYAINQPTNYLAIARRKNLRVRAFPSGISANEISYNSFSCDYNRYTEHSTSVYMCYPKYICIYLTPVSLTGLNSEFITAAIPRLTNPVCPTTYSLLVGE